MKVFTLSVDLVVELPDTVNPDEVTFEIPLECIRVDGPAGSNLGKVISYSTQEDQS